MPPEVQGIFEDEQFLGHARRVNNVLQVGRRGWKTLSLGGGDDGERENFKKPYGAGPNACGEPAIPNRDYLYLNGYEHFRVGEDQLNRAVSCIVETDGRPRS